MNEKRLDVISRIREIQTLFAPSPWREGFSTTPRSSSHNRTILKFISRKYRHSSPVPPRSRTCYPDSNATVPRPDKLPVALRHRWLITDDNWSCATGVTDVTSQQMTMRCDVTVNFGTIHVRSCWFSFALECTTITLIFWNGETSFIVSRARQLDGLPYLLWDRNKNMKIILVFKFILQTERHINGQWIIRLFQKFCPFHCHVFL